MDNSLSSVYSPHPSKSISKSLPLNKHVSRKISTPGKYIKDSLIYVEKGCYQKGKIKIDGGIGDYRMSIFRLKDRLNRQRQRHTSFTEQKIKKINSLVPPQQQKDILEVISSRTIDFGQVQVPEEQVVYTKGKLQSIKQQSGALFYKYLPKYQQRWFNTIDNSSLGVQDKLPLIKQNTSKPLTVRKIKPKRRALFYKQQQMAFSKYRLT